MGYKNEALQERKGERMKKDREGNEGEAIKEGQRERIQDRKRSNKKGGERK